MVHPAYYAFGAVPAIPVLFRTFLRGKPKMVDDGNYSNEAFVCERVCTSDRLLKRLGGSAKNVTRGTCVTVCGTNQENSCTDACQKSVCMTLHDVPAWNDQCVRRCTKECMRLSSPSPKK